MATYRGHSVSLYSVSMGVNFMMLGFATLGCEKVLSSAQGKSDWKTYGVSTLGLRFGDFEFVLLSGPLSLFNILNSRNVDIFLNLIFALPRLEAWRHAWRRLFVWLSRRAARALRREPRFWPRAGWGACSLRQPRRGGLGSAPSVAFEVAQINI